MKRIGLLFIFIVFCTLAFCSCDVDTGASKSVTEYSLVHNSYLGEVFMSADKSGKITLIRFEEYYMPTTLCKVSNYTLTDFSSDQLKTVVTTSGSEDVYVKNIDIDGENFELYTVEFKNDDGSSYDPKRYTVDYKSDSRKSLNSYIVTDEGAEWYVKALTGGMMTVGKMVDDEYQDIASVNYSGGICKSATNYWATNLGERKGWALNMHLIQIQLIKEFNKADNVSLSDVVLDTMKVDSGATVTSFNDYVKLAFKAYNVIIEK